MDELLVCHLGRVEYRAAAELQEALRERVQAGELGDLLLLLEHPPVYTRGRRSDPGELPLGEAFYRSRGIDLVETNRGGRVTYHGPGQLVGYPIMRIGAVRAFVETMEAAIAAALAQEGIVAGPREGLTGVWAEDRKIASIGVHVSHRVTTHGFAINVDNDLAPFDWVVPCGIAGVRMTSVSVEKSRNVAQRTSASEVRPGEMPYSTSASEVRPGRDVAQRRSASEVRPGRDVAQRRSASEVRPGEMPCFSKRMAHAFATAHGRRQRLVTPQRIGIERPAGALQPA